MGKTKLFRHSAYAAIALSTLLASPSAHAFELFGYHLWGEKKDPNADVIGTPQNYSVEFNVPNDDDSGIKDTLEGASTLVKDDEKPASGAAGLLAKARGDYKKLLATLYSEGRYGGTISITVDGREAADIPPDATLSEPAKVVVTVDPGPAFNFSKAEVENQAPAPTHRKDVVPLPQDEGFAAGEVAKSGVILRAEKLAVEAWRQQGHAKASPIDRRVEAAHDTSTVDATIGVDPGPLTYYGATDVKGAERMDPEFIAYMAGLKPGEEFDPDDLERANKRLSRLEVFRALRIEEGETLGPNGTLPIIVNVQERMPRRFGVGATYSTLDGAGVEAYWMHRNLFGRAERLRLDAKISGISSTDPRDFTYRIGPTFTKPGVFTPDTDFVASLLGEREVLDAYTRTAVTGQAGFTHQFTDELSGRLFGVASRARFEDDVFGKRDFTTVGVLGGLTYDSRDNAADATRGVYLDGQLDPFFELQQNNFAARFLGEARGYYGFGEKNSVVLAGRVKVGSIVGADIGQLPPDKLFFAGGGGSVRGYGYRTIGVPVTNMYGEPDVIGGRSLVEASAEARVKVTDSIGLVGFIDGGYVGAESYPDFASNMKFGAGVGLRYYTGLGPIRADIAMPLDKGPDDPNFALYIGIGQAF